jgi:hypothetical protein
MLSPHASTMSLDGPLKAFAAQGFARLGPVLSQPAAALLAERADALMLGQEAYPGLFYQHDSDSGDYEDLRFNVGWIGPSKRYRKLERLELDPIFLAFIENPLFERLAHRVLGDPVLLYRSVLWNKAASGGMATPWHQDDGRFWGLSRPPVLQVWTALDDAPIESGCLEVVPGSHLAGLASREGGTLSGEQLAQAQAEARAVALPARRGESVLVHNHTWHRTGHNQLQVPRRAVSVSFLDGAAQCTRRRRAPRQFRRLFVDTSFTPR